MTIVFLDLSAFDGQQIILGALSTLNNSFYLQNEPHLQATNDSTKKYYCTILFTPI
jgi:hypothetical protein